ncbi:hypothetical protein L226DRAFT_615116 [Lentinus tigrinus ALCF2SS1-7]|uniref:F-box domain-containing protein n=1 Tax=Lentinus tigrinus ALCF2SS1-6 TaxID=1328759 RepID=A0A5C2S1R6_9APHY|nr:hypothetical protein L227DRAFT_231785 [Lentinus tigrinus ALCF2SS1-6]RPD72133.1 hypothetical protein L226DRAFT_615116 [Lentinus tigrinus ALCF2SS1-7]
MSFALNNILSNKEIVSNIASFAYWGRNVPDTPLDLRNVLALALSCRPFSEPCLDQLWRRQLNLFNLYKTLPKDAWEVYDGKYVGPNGERQQCIKATRVLIPTDWFVFDWYAPKIRELGFDPRAPSGAPQPVEPWRPTGFPLNTFMALCVVRLPRELLPNIRRVRWTTHEFLEDTHIHVFIFQNPPLVSLYMDYSDLKMKIALPEPEPEPEPEEEEGSDNGEDGEGEQEEGETTPLADPAPLPDVPPPPPPGPPPPPSPPPPPPSFEEDKYIKYTLKALLEECPKFRDVEIVAPQFQGYQWAIKDFIRELKDNNLRTFAINLQGWEDDDLECLAGITSLRKTRIFLRDTDCAWLSRAMETGTPFANVVDLTVDAPSFEFFTAFFLQFDGSRLESLALTATDRPAPEVLHTCLSTIATSCSVSTLRAISLSDNTPPPKADTEPDGSPNGASAEVLNPLTTFVHLRAFAVDLAGAYALDNAGLAMLVSAWPALERLTLGVKHGWGTRSVLTFAGLAKVVELCPRLEQLAVAIDATVDDLPAVGPAATNAIVGTVNLLDSYVVEHPDVGVVIAKNLSALFTDLLYVRAWTKPEPEPEPEQEEGQMNVEGTGQPDADGGIPPPIPQAVDGDVQMGDETTGATTAGAAGPQGPEQLNQPQQPQPAEGAAGGEGGEEAQPVPEEEPVRLPEWLVSREFWETVEKQVATFALLRDIGIPMDLS